MKTRVALMAVAAMSAGMACAAPAWTTGVFNKNEWTASTSNLLTIATISTPSLAGLSDGIMAEFGDNGNVGNNTLVSWTLDAVSTIYEINLFTCYRDAGRDGIQVDKIEMKYDGSDDWVDLGAPPVEFGTKRLDNGNMPHDGVVGTFKALYSDDTGAALATGVTAVRLTFGMQDNNKSGYGEIEAIGCSSQGWPPLAVTPLEEDFGTLTVSPAANANGYYDAGTVVNVAITVTNDVEFLMWKGHPPPGGEQSASVDITMDGIKSITASVLAPYLLYKNGKLTDGQMVMSANGETNAITVTKLSAFGDNGLVDLTKPIKGGGRIISIGEFEAAAIKSVVLPPTLQTIGHRAFLNCKSLTSITPMFPDSLTTLGGGAFADCGKFTGDVRLGFGTDDSGNPLPFTFSIHDGQDGRQRGLQFQADPVGPNVLLGPGVTAIPDNTFSSSGNITNLYLGANVSSIGIDSFAGLGASKNATVTFAGDMPSITTNAFGSNPTAYRIRFAMSVAGHPKWNAFVSDPAKVTPWSQLDATVRESYWTRFPAAGGFKRPYGITTAGAIVDGQGLPANEWVLTDKHVGMLLQVR